MNRRTQWLSLVGGLSLLVNAGCIVIGVRGWAGPSIWTEAVVEERALDATDLTGIEVRTHNGSVTFAGQPAGSTDGHVTITKKAGGLTVADAEKALEAIDVYVEPAGAGGQRIGWRWKGIKHPTWRAQVSFDIQAPGQIRFDGETHNGSVSVHGVVGEVRVETHNGRVDVESSAGRLYAETHNGRINTRYVGDDVTLVTHNGRVVADLSECAAIDGHITTHNGGIEVTVGPATSARLNCSTHNGAIRCKVPLDDSYFARRRLTGTIGTGEGDLVVTTHNGGVRIKTAG